MPAPDPKVECANCGETYYVIGHAQQVVCRSPVEGGDVAVGTIYGVLCPNQDCESPMLYYARDAHPAIMEPAEFSIVYPTPEDRTLEIVITIIIEFESFKQEKETGQPYTDEQKQELRTNPRIIETAKTWIGAATASGAGAVIAGLLGG